MAVISALGYDNPIEKYNIGKYYLNEAQLPFVMEQYGFKHIKTGYVLVDLTPDNLETTPKFAVRFLPMAVFAYDIRLLVYFVYRKPIFHFLYSFLIISIVFPPIPKFLWNG